MTNLIKDRLTKIVQFILNFLILLNIIVFFSKKPIQDKAYLDVKNQLQTCDVNGWAIYGLIDPGFHLDITRAAREGWIDNDATMPFSEKTVVKVAQNGWLTSCQYAASSEKILLKNLTLLEMGFLFDMDRWVSDYLEIDWIKDRTFQAHIEGEE